MFGLTAVASTTSLGLDLSLSGLTGEATKFKKVKACPTYAEGYVLKKYFEAHNDDTYYAR